jgi:hypothetical protein
MTLPWEEVLTERLQLYGHRNWLVVADSAYPAQAKEGIETIVADEEQTAVLTKVLSTLRAAKHVRPTVYVDRELTFVPEEDAAGVSSYREELEKLLRPYDVRALPHDQIITKLDLLAKKFRVLLIKTNMRIPYTSVFFELECGYWEGQAEMRLRAAMRWGNGRQPASKRSSERLIEASGGGGRK